MMACKRPCWLQEMMQKRWFQCLEGNLSPCSQEDAAWEASGKGTSHLLQVGACAVNHDQLDEISVVAQLKACALQKDLKRGSHLHMHLHRKGLVKKNIFVGNTLVHMYAKCGALSQAKGLFDELPIRTVVSWTALIAGYSHYGQGEEALNLFEQMKEEGLIPDDVTLISILKACGTVRSLRKGEKAHAVIIREGFLVSSEVLGGALVDMYAKCGDLTKAQKVFDDLPYQNLVAWTVLIGGYSEQGCDEDAIRSFANMRQKGLLPDPMVFASVLKACARLGAADIGEELHYEIVRKGLLENDSILGNAIVDMYAKSGALVKAWYVFKELSCRNVVSWNVLMTGFCQQQLGELALECFNNLKHDQICPDSITYACALKACGIIGALAKGKEIHTEIVREGLYKKVKIGTALVDMYAKCGALGKAREVFELLSVRNSISWTALIAGYSEHGYGKEAITCFEKMQAEGLSPDAVTFSCILKACGSVGAVERGQSYFEALSSKFGIVPTLEHHTCLVGLLGRAGHIDKAISLLKKMPSTDCPTAWFVLLNAYQKWSNFRAEGCPLQG